MAPVVRTPHVHRQGPSCNPWLGNEDSASHSAWSHTHTDTHIDTDTHTQIYSPKMRKKKRVKENEKYLRDL